MNDQAKGLKPHAGQRSKHVSFGLSDQGRVRDSNQDQYLIAQLQRSMQVSSTTLSIERQLFGSVQGEVLLVADGMGGHAAGDRASSLAIGHLISRLVDSPRTLAADDESEFSELVDGLRAMLIDAHAKILAESAQIAGKRGMGTTLTMALVIGSRLHVVHVGDSRCYLIRGGVAEQLTTDHTLARQMVESGGLKPEEEAGSRWSNVLWNVLGGHSEGELMVEVRSAQLQAGDTIALCSDGLHRYVNARHLAAIIGGSDSPERACERLVAIANEAGGEDNITIVISSPLGDAPETSWDDFDTTLS